MPRLRGLRDPRRRAGLPARAGTAPREHRVHLRHRLLVAVPVLHEHLRDALDPRPRAGDRDRPGRHPAGPVGVGRHRRRRRAVHRRQPPDPRAAAQREPEDPAVQQPDLRAHQGAVLPHLRDRQDHEVHPDGVAGLPVQPGVGRARRRGDVRGPHPGLRPQAPHRGAAGRRRPRGHRAGGDLPELQHLQRRRLGPAEGPRHEGRRHDPAPARQADPVRQGRREGRGPSARRHDPGRRRGHGGLGEPADPRLPRGGSGRRLRR